MLANRLRFTTANQRYIANAYDFNGSTQYIVRATDFTGNADSKLGLFNGWFRLDGGDGNGLNIYDDGYVTISRNSSNIFNFILRNSANTSILNFSTVTNFTVGASWIHILSSWNLATGTIHLYANGASDKTVNVNTDDTIDYTQANHYIGTVNGAGGGFFDGCMSELYLAPGEYLDLSDSANLLKFRSASGKPVDLLTSGAPTGLLYLKSAVASAGTNSGSGGNLTVTNGPLSAASTSPSD